MKWPKRGKLLSTYVYHITLDIVRFQRVKKILYNLFWITHQTKQLGALSKRDQVIGLSISSNDMCLFGPDYTTEKSNITSVNVIRTLDYILGSESRTFKNLLLIYKDEKQGPRISLWSSGFIKLTRSFLHFQKNFKQYNTTRSLLCRTVL